MKQQHMQSRRRTVRDAKHDTWQQYVSLATVLMGGSVAGGGCWVASCYHQTAE